MSTIPKDGDPGELVCRCASEIEMRPVEWLWPGRVAVGAHTCIAGEPGTGKSQLSTYIAAQISMGREWPCGEGRAPKGSVLILSAEDSESNTIVPRLHAAKADLGSIHTISAVKKTHDSSRSFNLEQDIELLERKIKELGDVALVQIDPISSYLGKTNSHNNSEIRGVLEPLSAMADRTGVAILSVTHFSKSGAAIGSKPIHRFIGSIAFVGAPRMAFALVEDPEDGNRERRLLLGVKNNLAPEPQGLACKVRQTIVGDDIVTSRIDWEPEPVDITAKDALAAEADSGGLPRQEAEAFLRELLADGPKTAKQVEREAEDAGIAWRTVRRAKERVGVRTRREQAEDGQWRWVWSSPEASKMATPKSGQVGHLPGKTTPQNNEDGQDGQLSDVATLPSNDQVDLTLPECLKVENRAQANQAA